MRLLKTAAILSACFIASAIGQTIGPPGGSGGGGTPGGSTGQMQYNNSSAFGGANFYVEDANTLGQRNGTTAQITNIYKTFTSATNFESIGLGYNSTYTSYGLIASVGSGGGTLRNMMFGYDQNVVNSTGTLLLQGGNGVGGTITLAVRGGDALTLGRPGGIGAGNGWAIDGTAAGGHLNPNVDVSSDIGGASFRPRDLYVGRNPFFNGLSTDAGKTTATLCADTTTGQVYKGSGTVGICLGTSSARFKDAIKPLDSGLMQIAALSPKTFRYRAGYGDDGAKEQLGFIAEDVVKVAPKLVGLNADGLPNTVDMVGMIPMLVKAVQEQQAVIECLRSKKSKC